MAGETTCDMLIFGVLKASEVKPTRVLPVEELAGLKDDSAWRIDQASFQGGRAAFPRFKASEVQRRTWVVKHLAAIKTDDNRAGLFFVAFFCAAKTLRPGIHSLWTE
jgi:hypothetical protein